MPTRCAHTVHLTAPTAALIRRGALLLEDALHTASLPEGSRLLLIRHLDVGRIHPRRSPATLALTIEQQIQRIVPIPASDPAAPTAAAVFFEDALEPYRLLCQHLAQGKSPTAWFWRTAVPQWQPYQLPAETYRQILLHLAQQPQGVLAIAHLLHHLQRHQTLTPLLSTLTPQDATALLTLCHLPQTSSPYVPVSPPPRRPAAPPLPLAPTLVAWLPIWGEADVQSHWLTLTALIHANPSRLLSPDLPLQAQTLLHQLLAAPAAAIPTADLFDAERTHKSRPHTTPPISPDTPFPISPIPSTSPIPLPSGLHVPLSPRPPLPASPGLSPAPPHPRTHPADWHPTPYGGFFFTINLLKRLKFPQYLSQNPVLIETRFPTLLLLALAHRLDIPPEDSIYGAIDLPTNPSPDAQHPPHLFHPSIPTSPHPWLRLLDRWCHHYLNQDLPTLVNRPGELRVTPTHLDLRFNLDYSDIRIRRTGLDLNPGWVPWLGRVIAFHYHGGPTHAV